MNQLKSEQTDKEKQEQEVSRKQHTTKNKRTKKPKRRIVPIGFRILFVLLLSAISLMVGLMVGYGVIGDGNPIDALKIETWQHIIDFVTK